MNYGVLLFDFGTTGGVAAGTSVDRQQSQFRKLNTAPGASAPLPTPLAPALVWGGLRWAGEMAPMADADSLASDKIPVKGKTGNGLKQGKRLSKWDKISLSFMCTSRAPRTH